MKTLRVLIQTLMILFLAASLGAVMPVIKTASAGNTITVCENGCDYNTIQNAINAASAGDTVYIKNGSYTSGTIIISKSITITGESQYGVLIKAGTLGYYGLYVEAINFTIQDVTIENNNNAIYGLKISGSSNVQVKNVTVRNFIKSGVDLIGCNNATLENVYSHNNGGVGIAVSNSTNITLRHITTSNNTWGGVGLFTNKTYYKDNLSDGKTGLDGVKLEGTNSFGELNPLYFEYADSSHVIRNFEQNDFSYWVKTTATSLIVYYQKTKESSLSLINALDTFTTPPGLFKPTAVIQRIDDDSFHVFESMKIQSAIQMGAPNATIYIYKGVFSENLNINKPLRLIGVGSDSNPSVNTILKKNLDSAVVTLSASGSGTNPILLKDLRIEPEGVFGINVAAGTVEHVRLENVKIVGTRSNNGNEVGLKVATAATLRNLTVEGSSFDKLGFGWYFAKHGDWTPNSSTVENVIVNNTTFNENSFKGIYVEKLSKANFTNVVVEGNGWYTLSSSEWNAGIDINLKGETGGKTYQDLIFNNLTVRNNALGTKNGAGLMIKARDDGSTYSLYPAILNNVQIIGGVFENNERGIRFGEPLKNNAGPSDAVIQNAVIRNNKKTYTGTDGTAYGDLINYTQQQVKAENNFWGTISWAGYGSITGIQYLIYGNVDWQPWANSTFTQELTIPTITYADDDNASKAEGESGANGGTVGYDAFATIQDALKHVAAGGTVYVGAGNYSGDIQINKAVTFTGQNRPVLDGRFWVNANNVTIQGFEIRNGLASIGVNQSAIYISSGLQNITIQNNHLIGTWTNENSSVVNRGIEVSYHVNNLLVDGNIIEKWLSGIYLNPTTGQITVTNNEFRNNWAGTGTDGQTNVTFRNNYFIGNIEGIGASAVGASFLVEKNAFLNNTTAVAHYGGAQIKAERNWWNHQSGPTITSNPGGSGQPVMGNVDFVPWLCEGTDSQPDVIGFQPAEGAAACTTTSEAKRLVFVAYPTGGFENVPFAIQPVVRAEDNDGNLAINFNGAVLLQFANNPAGGSLQGVLLTNAVNGIATFNDVSITKAGENYRLTAFTNLLEPAVGAFFNILPQSADLSVSISATPNPVEAGATLTYSVGLENLGVRAANNITLTINLPQGVTFLNGGGAGWTCSHNNGIVTCVRFTLVAGGNAPVTITVTAPSQAGSIMATVAATTETLDFVPENNQASVSTLVIIIPETGPQQTLLYLPLVRK